jgi:hypothetical protein
MHPVKLILNNNLEILGGDRLANLVVSSQISKKKKNSKNFRVNILEVRPCNNYEACLFALWMLCGMQRIVHALYGVTVCYFSNRGCDK